MTALSSIKSAYGITNHLIATLFGGTLYPNLKVTPVDLQGKTVIITGANVGIGLETARKIASYGAHVVLACRNAEKAEVAKEDIIKSTGNENVEVRALDLGSFESVRQFVREWDGKPIDILINNAGMHASRYEVGPDGYELSFTTNALGQILFTTLLLPCLTQNARIVNVASGGHYQCGRSYLESEDLDGSKYVEQQGIKRGEILGYSLAQNHYGRTKLAQVIWTRVLKDRLEASPEYKDKKIFVAACHPGMIKSDIFKQHEGISPEYEKVTNRMKKVVGYLGISAEQGACTSVWLAVEPSVKSSDGIYWERQCAVPPNSLVSDVAYGETLYAAWLKACGLSDDLKA